MTERRMRERPRAKRQMKIGRMTERRMTSLDEGASSAVISSAVLSSAALSSAPISSDVLLDLCDSFSPRIEAAGEAVYLDLGPKPDEEAIGKGIQGRAQDEGLSVGVGVASNKLVARLAAGQAQNKVIVVPVGEERRFLGVLPIAELKPSAELSGTLERWGIHTLGELAQLPPEKMITYLGKEGWMLQQAARGIDSSPFIPFQRKAIFLEKMTIEWPITEMEQLLLYARPLIERLIVQLTLSDLACQTLEIGLQLDPQGEERRSIRLRAPTRDVKTLLRLLHEQLLVQPPRSAVSGLIFLAHPDWPRQAQLSLFGPPSLSPARIATTLAELSTLLGAERIGAPLATEGHRPERFQLEEYDPPPVPLLSEAVADQPALSAIRVLRPPIRLEVTTAQHWPHEPLLVRAPDAPSLHLAGNVCAASGPWALEEHWWREADIQRTYWDIELTEGGIYRIYYDARQKIWFADGMYD